jgi:TP901 family phage tail tape measure protein
VVPIATRNTKVSLTAEVAGYIQGMDAAARKTRELGTESEKLAQKKEAFQTLGVGALAFGAVAAAAVGIAVAKFAEFDAAMSNVKAATQETASNMGLLREAALNAGAETVYSATEAAGAIEELGKAGLTTSEILNGGLDGALSLAAAGQLEVADAAQVTAIALKQFQLGGDQASHVADLLAAGAGKAVGDVSDLAAALGQAGLVANGAGQSIEDTTGVLAAFADAGLLGSDAGTSLKTAIIALQAPTEKSRDLMEKYGLSFYDTNGQMLTYSEIAGQLQTKLGGLDDETRNAALAQIFGNDALRSANVLYEQGASGIQKYVDQTNDSGYASQVAADRLDNLKGDVEKLGGAFDTALIRSGSSANDTLRQITQSATFLVDAFGSLPEPVLGVGLAVGAVAAAMALAGGAALTMIPKVVAAKDAFVALGISGKSAAIGVGAVGLALGAIVVAGALVVGHFAEISAGAEEFAGTLDKSTGAMTKYSRELVAKKLAESNASDVSKLAGVSQEELTDAILENGDALDDIISKINSKNTIAGMFDGTSVAAGNAVSDLVKIRESVGQGQDQWESYKEGLAEVEATSEEQATSLASLSGAADDTRDSVKALSDEIRNFGSAQFDVEQAAISFQQSLADLDGALAEGAGSLDISTEAGRRTQSALLDVASSANEFAAAQVATGASTEAVQGTLEAGRQKIVDTRIALGDSAEAAQAYADRLMATPESISTAVKLEKDAAEAALYELTRDRYVNVISTFITGSQPVGGLLAPNENGGLYVDGVQAFANGGFPTGIYSGRPGGIHKFAEENVGWEAYVSGKPGQEDRNRGILMDAASRLGMGSLVPAGGGGGQNVYHNTFVMQPLPGIDPEAAATIMGREFARRAAG